MATAFSTSFPSRSSSARSGPKIFTPTGVRIPVASMSIRPLMGMVQEFGMPGNRMACVHLCDQGLEGQPFPPLLFRLEDDGGLEHGQRCRIRGSGGPPGLPEHRYHLREGGQNAVLLPHGLMGRPYADARKCHGHVEDGALIQGRHELRADSLKGKQRQDHDGQGGTQDRPTEPEGELQHGL